MKVYKFKDLTNEEKHSHFLQIVLDNSIWYARPDDLNDEDEFKFEFDCDPSQHTEELLAKAFSRFGTSNLPPDLSISHALHNKRIEALSKPVKDDLIKRLRDNYGIASFSEKKDDEYLWAEYGGKGNGVVVEISIPDHISAKHYRSVEYVSEKIIHIDLFLRSSLLSDDDELIKKIFMTKTKKWEQEQEIRSIRERQNVNMSLDGSISEITFGPNVPSNTLKSLKNKIINHCNAHNIRITEL